MTISHNQLTIYTLCQPVHVQMNKKILQLKFSGIGINWKIPSNYQTNFHQGLTIKWKRFRTYPITLFFLQGKEIEGKKKLRKLGV